MENGHSKDLQTPDIDKSLGLFGLIGMVVGITLATGVWSIAGDFPAKGAYSGAVIIGWLICGIGMYGLMNCFVGLSYVKPKLTGGIFTFAQAGFGDYVGFNSAWGYWVCSCLSQVAVVALLLSTLSQYFPIFGNGSNLFSIIFGSLLLWFYTWITAHGVREAATLNLLVAIVKSIPLLMVVILPVILAKFHLSYFMANFWGDGTNSLLTQVKGTSTITLWVFAGIEAAIAVSGRAKKMSDVGRATSLGFAGILALYVLITTLSMGVLPHDTLAKLPNPSVGGVMTELIGPIGGGIVTVAVIISTLGALLAVTIVCAEVANNAAKHGSFCNIFKKENKHGSPINALIISMVVIQVFMIIMYFNKSTYQIFYTITANMVMMPYLLSAIYYLMVTIKGDGFENYAPSGGKLNFQRGLAVLGVIYSLWLIYASGLTGLLITTLLYAPGTIVYLIGKKEQNKPGFAHWYDWAVLAIILIGGIASLILILTGIINPF